MSSGGIYVAQSFQDLQNSLIDKIGELLSEMSFEKADGTTVAGAAGYPQQLPKLTQDDEDPDQFFPYYIVKIIGGHTATDNEPWDTTVDIMLGCYSDDAENNGHLKLLDMIKTITEYFQAYPLLNHKYRALQDMEFAIQDEDTYPYFFGGIEMKFWVARARREDEYS